MKTNRRKFITTSLLAGSTTSFLTLPSCDSKVSEPTYPDYSMLDNILKQPVLKKDLFPRPVIIESIELLRDRDNFICRVRSKDGAEGVSIGHPFISRQGYPMFINSLHHRFIGKDARDLDDLIFNAVEGNIKSQGVPLCVQIATIEFAILDMLGNMADKPVGQLIGEIAVYCGHD